ncbi:MAG: hypothetical protein A3G34_08960 [Candidatus Lindowbacteria bacterium RIFCSPLOWO2_12_FULL_62_27]|nr:MAG: hypothetical protein A3I06_08820 [Candidatus Lindowbacteria bacterium RIFCSPLOWO2_02_FULL_62_12]OGH60826.1 MAG: hypothetical protein A3G34_08960 [Candidatus Lindowbacteria bacterium RIFCSPLOWO2_12_FULL_62_27]
MKRILQHLKTWWGTVVGAGAFVVAVFGLAPDPPQIGLFHSAMTQDRILKEAQAEVYAPDEYDDYVRAMSRVKEELAAQQAKFYYSRQYLTFERLSREAVEASGRAEKAARENRSAVKQEASQLAGEARTLLGAVRARTHRVGLSDSGRASLVRVEVLLREADMFGREDRWHESNDRVRTALTFARTAHAELQNRVGRYDDAGLIKQWDRWVYETLDWSSRNGERAVVVVKSRNLCLLLESGHMVRAYDADLGKNGVFDKSYRGDYATPEGKYRIIKKKGAGQSKYHKALLINYPNDEDIRAFRRDRTLGRVSIRSRLGGHIEIHGDGGRDRNWTEGCVALPNADMDHIFSRTAIGTPVTIVGNFSDFDRLFSRPNKS